LNKEKNSSAPNLTSPTGEKSHSIIDTEDTPPLSRSEPENCSEEKTPTVTSFSTEEQGGESTSSSREIYVSKKPTINSLLSPTSSDRFADMNGSKTLGFPPLPSVEE
jgi:hypothetical protein